ncbi:unnamed protein product [Vitrella brassicaformis CCMP3155]|uniref:Uncharacterized protein n=1 Tax=Vitrella brassicaformis (strain CCMP3155) TaxID=1169540 RepID=A0A0G4EGE9_VITBC|nr:unnamed protein product [Vitrella brassicaformis CCMP3155]|eukprot:CEL94550.1 unnamed protein product [Vitrella brassicaformis CCMP3155]
MSLLPQSGGGTHEVAEAIEKAFIAACSRTDLDYQETLRQFIRPVITAYEKGFNMPALLLEVSTVDKPSIERPLMVGEVTWVTDVPASLTRVHDRLFAFLCHGLCQPDEAELRTIWMSLIFLTLQTVGWPQLRESPSQLSISFEEKFSPFVANVVEAHRRGFDLRRLKLEEMISRTGSDKVRTPIEQAMLQQSMRIIFLTLSILEDLQKQEGRPWTLSWQQPDVDVLDEPPTPTPTQQQQKEQQQESTTPRPAADADQQQSDGEGGDDSGGERRGERRSE